MKLGERVKIRREELGLTREDLAKKAGMSINTLIKLEDRPSDRTKFIDELVVALETSKEWLVAGVEPMEISSENTSPAPELRQDVPLLGKVSAGAFVHTRELEAHEVEDWLMAPKDYKGRAFGLRIEGDSMTSPIGKSYPDGAIAVFDSGNKTPNNGNLVLAKVNGSDEVTFKKYVTDAGYHYLMPLNPNYPRIDKPFRVLAVFEYAIIF